MRKLNVIDLDNTLIPFDSFRRLILQEIRSLNTSVILFSLLRFARIIGRKYFTAKIIRNIGYTVEEVTLNGFIQKIITSIDNNILEIVDIHTDENTINVICSASPNIYVSRVAEQLGWIGFGSHFNEKEFIYLYGVNKLRFIKEKFSTQKNFYNFAISDSESDLPLLKEFDNYILLNND